MRPGKPSKRTLNLMNTLLRELLFLIQPLTLAWLLLTIWILQMIWKKLWRWAALPSLAWLILSLITCTAIPSWLLAKVENRYPQPTPEQLANADAIICLGGGVEPSLTEPTGMHLVRGADRFATALSMSLSGMAPVLVLGGGGYPHKGELISEADALRDHLAQFPGIGFQVVSLGVCANTRDESLKVAELVQQQGWKKVLLVTSASHMPRSVATFEKTGVPVVPVPCHYLSSFNRVGDIDWLHMPYAGSFELFDSWFHEFIGTWIYQWRGWM